MVVAIMAEMSASEYAKHHDISTRRAQAAAAAGHVDARRVGGRWLIDDGVPHQHAPGRPLSRRSAAALVAMLSDDPHWPDGLSSSERRRTLDRLVELRRDDRPAERLSLWVRSAHPSPLGYEAHEGDLADLRRDDRLVLGGSSDDRSGMGDGGRVEAHVAGSDLAAVTQEYLLLPSRRPNVLLRVHDGPAPRPLTIGELIVDLATSQGPRERAAATRLLLEGTP